MYDHDNVHLCICFKAFSHVVIQSLTTTNPSNSYQYNKSVALDALMREFATADMRAETYRLMDEPLPPASQLALRIALDASASDPFGDGDQSDVPDPADHPLRHAWATGLVWQATIVHPGIPSLLGVPADTPRSEGMVEQGALACYTGDAVRLNELLDAAMKETEKQPQDLKKTLEARVS